jgi:hypothetical protein
MNNAASVVFVAETRLPPSTFAAATGVWRSRGEELEPLAVVGQSAPGTQSPTTFERFAFVNQNAGGLITFTANAETAAHALLPGVWAFNASGQLLPIASADTPIELRPGDTRAPSFGAFANTSSATRPLNDANQMLFHAVFPGDAYALLIASVPPGCPADFNTDAFTNGLDLSILLSQFGQSLPPGSGADTNRDGIVDGRDLSVLLGSFGCTA